jgi:hypothetical protein
VTDPTVPPELFLHHARARKALPFGSTNGVLAAFECTALWHDPSPFR